MEEIKTININNKGYPELLKKISNPPKTLYFKGEIFPKESCFGIVGTRRFSSYGKQVALEIARDLVNAGLTIVSGLAPGIDTFVHQAVVEENKRTIAVLGTGLNERTIYPQSNLRLANKILQSKGALISEYPPKTPGSKFTFPQRNRIISGLCLGVLVIEAKQRSGALITAQYATAQKRKIFAIPGPIYSSNSKGCHYLIKKGAKLVESVDDILKELDLSPTTCFSKEISAKSPQEQIILKTLKEETLHIDKIIKKTKLETSEIIGMLTDLEIQGKIRNLGGNIYALRR